MKDLVTRMRPFGWKTRILPLALGLMGAVSIWLPRVQAGPCEWQGCGIGNQESGNGCNAQSEHCGFFEWNWSYKTSWTRIECNNGDYIISGCRTNADGCCIYENSGPGCTDGNYC